MIFALLYERGHFMLSRNFRLQRVGDIPWLKRNYKFSRIAFSIDELIVLDVSRGERNQPQFLEHLKSVVEGCFVPIAAGGGVRDVDYARALLRSGADKVVVNTPLFDSPELVRELAADFGQQCIVGSIDVKKADGEYQVWVDNGSRRLDGTLAEWLKKIAPYPVGELYLNSMDRDGTGQGYDVGLLDQVPSTMTIPVILAGGAGNYHHLAAGLSERRVDAVATAHLFNFVGDGLEVARARLHEEGFDLAKWKRSDAEALRHEPSPTH